MKRRHILEKVLVHFATFKALSAIFGGNSNPQFANLFLSLKFSRHQELEADEGGLKRLQKAQIDVLGFQHFFERAESSKTFSLIFSDHPTDSDRIALIKKFQSSPTQAILTQDEWNSLKKICQ